MELRQVQLTDARWIAGIYNHYVATTALIAQLRELGIKNAIGTIALPNPSSVALHEKMGFRKVGEFANIGFKFDHHISVGYWQLELN